MARIILTVPPQLAPILRYVHIELATAGEALIPATPFPALCVFIDGSFAVETLPDRWQFAADAFLAGPTSRPLMSRATPHATLIMLFFRPACVNLLFDLPLQEATDTHVPLTELVGAAAANELLGHVRDGKTPNDWAARLLIWVQRRLAVREGRLTTRGLCTLPNLFLPSAYLAEQSGLGLRQFERRFLANYGQSLRDMRCMVRYVNALSSLISAPPERGDLARIAQNAGYFDQAHLTREFRRLTGIAPGQFIRNIASDPALRLMRYEGQEKQTVLDHQGDSLWELPAA